MTEATALDELLAPLDAESLVVALTGAGVSAESGIPTFRGADGYWRVGSRNYHPQELATYRAFSQMPWEVWAWYLYRRSVCLAARPNPAHLALAKLEAARRRFFLVTQNVDGLHLRAGNSLERTYQIHGNIDFMRCADGCCSDLFEVPEQIDRSWEKGRALTTAEQKLLLCPRCQGQARPHVLWFDETYDEPLFRYESSMAAASAAELLVVLGTTGETTLPFLLTSHVARRGVPLLAVNLEPNQLTDLVSASPRGLFIEGRAGDWLPRIAGAVASRQRRY
ncbi:MAG: RNA polymerase subunit sigma [Proteobacteria bacterium]|nr:RNA polymerase subunit sigma [Pseudomonadota bacterium]